MKDLLIGLDFGSDSVRAVLVSSTGEELKSCVHNYTRWNKGLYSDNAIAQFRQHPLDYLEGMTNVIRGVMEGEDPARIAGILQTVCRKPVMEPAIIPARNAHSIASQVG